ncbi:OmpH family outer membrane protein [Terracidiphilus gabretensis]|jgi:outer membrane protein|uniref:OmpH family outer membrane protein n=1 Tax=Terracidiphilus gabretensis TaxID=1577687 RepID=UPI00071B762C|nr:OmpH family outer membrane protein [Terracidiphilus gabretensis]
MKRTIALAALAVSSLSFAPALIQAQTPAAPLPGATGSAAAITPTGSSQIAIIAFEVAVSRTNEFQLKLADLQKKWGPRQQQLKTAGDDLDNQTKQLQAQADKLSETERATRTKALEDKRKELQRSFEDARNQYQQDMQGALAGVQEKFFDVMREYVEKNGYTLVLNISPQNSPVMYSIDSTDITAPVVTAYNVKSGVPAPPQPAASAPAAPRPATPKPAPKQ